MSRGLRRALVLVAGAVALAPAAPAAAATGIEVVVGGQTIALDGAALGADLDVPPTAYVVDGVAQEITGISLRRAITAADADPDAASAITVTGAGGRRLQISPPQIADPAPSPDGPVVLWVGDDEVTRLLSPAYTNAAGRSFPSRVIASVAGAPLRLELEDATLIAVGVLTPADGQTAKAGERLFFRALATGAGAGGPLTYAWAFDDGSGGRGQEVRHAYAQPGRYRVTVTVSDGAGGGGSATVTVEVPEPEPEPEPERTARGGGGAAGGSGSGSGSDGGAGAGGAPSGGAAAGGTPSAASTGDTGPATPASAPAATPAPAPAPAPEPKRPRPRRTPDRPAADRRPQLPTVEGIALASALSTAAAVERTQPAGSTTRTTTDEPGELDVPWVALALALAFVSGLQAARLQRRRWDPRRR